MLGMAKVEPIHIVYWCEAWRGGFVEFYWIYWGMI